VASADQLTDNYALLANSIMSEQNWQKDLKYLIPALANFLMTIIAKHSTYAVQQMKQITMISQHLLSVQMRMESSALLIAQTIYERVGPGFDNGEFLRSILTGVFTSLHFYRNNTKSKVIPSAIMKCVHTFFSTLMICNSTKFLMDACDQIQPGILLMILKSEAAAIKYVREPARDRKYCLVAYARLLVEYAGQMDNDQRKELICALIEAISPSGRANGF